MRREIAFRLVALAAVLSTTLPASAQAVSGAAISQQLRAVAYDASACYRVHDLSIRREDLRVYLADGYLIFSTPIQGEPISALFTAAEVEGGDAEAIVLPPNRGERKSLAKFTDSPNLDEHLATALMLFSDATAQDLRKQIASGGGTAAVEMGPLLAERWTPTLRVLAKGFELRFVQDILNPKADNRGIFFASAIGRKLGLFEMLYAPSASEQVVVGQASETRKVEQRPTGRSSTYDVWTSFASRSIRSDPNRRPQPDLTIESYDIDAQVDPDQPLRARTKARIKVGASSLRALPFDIAQAMKLGAVMIDGEPAELIVRDTGDTRGRPDENEPFLVVSPKALAPGSSHVVEFEHSGSVIRAAGNGVYYVGARNNWYPHSGDGFATYEVLFHYPKRLTLVASGDPSMDDASGDIRTTNWSTPVPVRVVGFNLGDYEKTESTAAGLHVAVYGNRNVESALTPRAPDPVQIVTTTRGGRGPQTQIVAGQAAPRPDPLARLRTVANDVVAALQFFNDRFGAPAMKSLTVSPVPDTFGQGFPGLLYLSTLAYLDPETWPASMRTDRSRLLFNELIESHEVAHQWWGNVVIPASYQDEWLQEGLADYSSLLWLEKRKGAKAMEDVLDLYRQDLLKKGDDGKTVESAGPITWGYRLEAGAPDSWRAITYEKGAWIFHMLRRRFGDEKFMGMLAAFRKRYEFRTVSTGALLALAKEFRPARMSESSVDEFFDNWVYSSGIPSFKLKSSVKGVAPAVTVSGTVEQSGIDSEFSAQVPVEIQFAKGPPQTIWVETSSESSPFTLTVKDIPAKVLIPNSILATKR